MAQKPNQIPPRLLKHLTGAANPDTYRKYFIARNCSEIRRILSKECHDMIDRSVDKTDNPEKFALPAWSEHAAYQSGYRKALREILDIIER